MTYNCTKEDKFNDIIRRIENLEKSFDKLDQLVIDLLNLGYDVKDIKRDYQDIEERIEVFENIKEGIVKAMFKDMFKIFLSIGAIGAMIYAYFKSIK